MARPAVRRRWRRVLMLGMVALLLVVLLLALGPRVVPHLQQPAVPAVPQQLGALQRWIDQREAATPGLRPDTQARIVWADPAHPSRTPCSMVYVHGFSASQGEGAPTHERLARTFGCNLYLARLPGHGLAADTALQGVDAQQLLDATAEALAVGRVLGDKVVLIGSSMGGALVTQVAAAQPAQVAALVLWSPLVRERNDQLQPMLWPWGVQAMLWSRNGGDPVMRHAAISPYWADAVHVDGYRAVTALSRGGMVPQVFARIHMPVFMGYYFKDAAHQDPSVSVAAMQAMFARLAVPAALREAVNFPEADAHVIASPLRSKAASTVFARTCEFLRRAPRLSLASGQVDCGSGWATFESSGSGMDLAASR